jgi:hypothetical protein
MRHLDILTAALWRHFDSSFCCETFRHIDSRTLVRNFDTVTADHSETLWHFDWQKTIMKHFDILTADNSETLWHIDSKPWRDTLSLWQLTVMRHFDILKADYGESKHLTLSEQMTMRHFDAFKKDHGETLWHFDSSPCWETLTAALGETLCHFDNRPRQDTVSLWQLTVMRRFDSWLW